MSTTEVVVEVIPPFDPAQIWIDADFSVANLLNPIPLPYPPEPKPKIKRKRAPRKKAATKKKMENDTVASGVAGSAADHPGFLTSITLPRGKKPGRDLRLSDLAGLPSAKKKVVAKKAIEKKDEIVGNDGAVQAPSVTGKKRKAVGDSEGEAPVKKIVKKDPIGDSYAELSESDKLLYDMRIESLKSIKSNNHTTWKEITEAWTKLTGGKPTEDYLRKRFPKLKAIAQTKDWLPLLQPLHVTAQSAKDEIDANLRESTISLDKKQIEEHQKTARAEKLKIDKAVWKDLVEALKSDKKDDWNKDALEIVWNQLKRRGKIDKETYTHINSDGGLRAASLVGGRAASVAGDDIGGLAVGGYDCIYDAPVGFMDERREDPRFMMTGARNDNIDPALFG